MHIGTKIKAISNLVS